MILDILETSLYIKLFISLEQNAKDALKSWAQFTFHSLADFICWQLFNGLSHINYILNQQFCIDNEKRFLRHHNSKLISYRQIIYIYMVLKVSNIIHQDVWATAVEHASVY